jgi:hypothetical protein
MLAPQVVRLSRQPGADAQPERRVGVERGQDMLKSRLEQDRAGNGPAFPHPQSGQAQRCLGPGADVTGLLREPVGTLEVTAASLQIAVRVPGPGSAREHVAELIVTLGDQFQSTRGQDPTRLTRHAPNLWGRMRSVETVRQQDCPAAR